MEIRLTDKEKTQKLLHPDAVYGIMQRILLRENQIDQDKEHFWMIGLNTAGYILYIELVSLGGMKSITIEPMNVYRFAVIKNAARVIAVHNHPSGSLTPSENDKNLTDRLIQVGRILDIRMEDHLVISTKAYLSFEAVGLMKKLKASLTYVPTYQIIEKIRKEEEKIRQEAIKAEKKLTKAAEEKAKKSEQALSRSIKFLAEKNMPTEEIAKVLKITLKEVEKVVSKKK